MLLSCAGQWDHLAPLTCPDSCYLTLSAFSLSLVSSRLLSPCRQAQQLCEAVSLPQVPARPDCHPPSPLASLLPQTHHSTIGFIMFFTIDYSPTSNTSSSVSFLILIPIVCSLIKPKITKTKIFLCHHQALITLGSQFDTSTPVLQY